MTPSRWSDVPLGSTDAFDDACEYRFRVNNMGMSTYGLTNGDYWYYATGVSTNGLIYISHDNNLSHINSATKSIFRWNGVALPSLPINQIQQRCGFTDPLPPFPI